MQTRRPKQRPSCLPLVLESNGIQQTIQVPSNEYPLYLPTPLFPAPGCLTGAPESPRIATDLRFLHIAGPSLETVVQRYAVEFAGARLNYSPSEFARTLAKIAFTAAVYVLGLAPFTGSPIRRVILGEDLSVSRWVGSWNGKPLNEPKALHAMKVLASGTDIHVVLRLFAQFETPEYLVVLGPAAPEFVNSAAWPFGAQSILYGDEAINIVNQKRRGVWPALDGDAYIANGGLGMVVGQYKGQKSKLKGLPSKLEVEFAGQPGHKFGFWKGEFGVTFLVLPTPCWLY